MDEIEICIFLKKERECGEIGREKEKEKSRVCLLVVDREIGRKSQRVVCTCERELERRENERGRERGEEGERKLRETGV